MCICTGFSAVSSTAGVCECVHADVCEFVYAGVCDCAYAVASQQLAVMQVCVSVQKLLYLQLIWFVSMHACACT